MMKRLKTMLAVIKPGDTFFARHDDGNATPSGSEGVGEADLRHTASLRASHPGKRRRHERAGHRARKPGAAVGQARTGTPLLHRHRLR